MRLDLNEEQLERDAGCSEADLAPTASFRKSAGIAEPLGPKRKRPARGARLGFATGQWRCWETNAAIEAPFELRRRGVEGKIVVGDREPEPDRTLLRTLSQAHAWTADLRSGKPLSEIAAAISHSESYIRTRSQLAFLSPQIQGAILEGRQPTNLTLERIIRKPVPLDWDAQARLYGYEGGARHP